MSLQDWSNLAQVIGALAVATHTFKFKKSSSIFATLALASGGSAFSR